ncbi:hypothetical protein SAMN04488693_101659 [Arthrobacter subterraneus]|uniref:Uncharacterized protein n=1 Tax=Arthrobacter subterraneus TaxID=335973 RepID=A0A1G8DN69_9MICC|nr:hypothetical protein [Arthrobacter subterraneus]SDH59045.1 hypothetical protein SAMN04488693_101659 [Arthrobacter subterraneus]
MNYEQPLITDGPDPAAAEYGTAGPAEPAVTSTNRGRGKAWLAGSIGAAAGLIVGVLVGQLEFEQQSAALSDAVTACGVESTDGILLGDEGQSISMQTEGAESFGAPYEDVACVLFELEVPDSIVSRIDSTRALDGRQEAEWENYSASWGYHPDSGLDIVVEISDEK